MSYLKPKQNYFYLSFVVATVFGFVGSGNLLLAQSDTRGSVQDPFSDAPDDPFELPDVGNVPTPDAPVVNPSAIPQFQDETVDEKYAGWRQASDGMGPERLDDILRSQWVMANDRGSISGTVYGIEDADLGNLELYLLSNGREVNRTKPNEDGSFQFSNAKQGTYALIAWGDNAFFAFGLNILDFNEAADANVPTTLEVTATPNKTTINTDWIRYFAGDVKFPVYGRFDSGEGEDDPPRLYGVQGLQMYLPEARPSTSISSHQVIPASNGRLIGRVHQISSRDGRPVDLRGSRILLLKDDDVFGAVTCDAYGVFEFPEIPAGEYSCVAVGQDSLGCIGITIASAGTVPPSPSDLEDEDADAGLEDPAFTPISFAMIPSEAIGWLNDKAMKTAYQRIISTPLPPINTEPQLCGSGCGSNCGNGCGSGRRAIRPGGYRPPPQSSIPKEQRFIPRFNNAIDRVLNPDRGRIPQGTGYGNGAYNSGVYGSNLGFGSYNSGGYAAGSSNSAPVVSAPGFSGSTTRNAVPAATSKR